MKCPKIIVISIITFFELSAAISRKSELIAAINKHRKIASRDLTKRAARPEKFHKMVKSNEMSKKMGLNHEIAEKVAKESNEPLHRIVREINENNMNSQEQVQCILSDNRIRKGLIYGKVNTDGVKLNINCDGPQNVRRIDGKCNNKKRKHWGSLMAPFRRLVKNTYEDGIKSPTGLRNNGTSRLPSPRLVSSKIHAHKEDTDVRITNMLMQMGQFLDHDITLAPEDDLDCCGSLINDKERCFNIPVANNDPFYSTVNPAQSCLPLTRSTPICSDAEIREQFNLITSFVDLSSIYGSDKTTNDFVRKNKVDGLLFEGNTFNKCLPSQMEATGKSDYLKPLLGLFYSGDIRVNEMPGLASLHTIFFREHNRIARLLKPMMQNSSDEEIFQVTRRIVIAEWQHIVYNEFLPVVVGPKMAMTFKLDTMKDSIYMKWINPGILHSFATAAYRFGHTLINGHVQKYRNSSNISSYAIRDNFFAANEIVQDNGDGMERIVEGLFQQNGQKYDTIITEEVTHHLFQEHGHNFGQDLVARNIQRGRDHGIGSYAKYRNFCGLTPLNASWEERPKEISQENWNKFKEVYDNPLEIELFSGGISEMPEMMSIVGPTFSCLISYQFYLLKHGDRFFFTHQCKYIPRKLKRKLKKQDRNLYSQLMEEVMNDDMMNKIINKNEGSSCDTFAKFNCNERNEIRKRTLGDILCENTDTIEGTTKYVNLAKSGSNPYIPCAGRSSLNLSIFTKTL